LTGRWWPTGGPLVAHWWGHRLLDWSPVAHWWAGGPPLEASQVAPSGLPPRSGPPPVKSEKKLTGPRPHHDRVVVD